MDTAPSPYYRLAEEFALHTGRSIYLTGKAGTGKTTFLRRLRAVTRKQTAVVAPTGVAAINAGGVTMHSFFQLPFGPFVPTPEGRARLVGQLHMQDHRRRVLRELELLVIDEVSMVRADTLDMVDTILRHVRFRPDEPFGGVQVVFIGDLYQLSPVVSDEEWRILAPYYPTPYFFHSQAVRQRPPVHIELDRIFRQADGHFIRLLKKGQRRHVFGNKHGALRLRLSRKIALLLSGQNLGMRFYKNPRSHIRLYRKALCRCNRRGLSRQVRQG